MIHSSPWSPVHRAAAGAAPSHSSTLMRLEALERKGMYWDCAESSAREDLRLIQGSLRPGETLEQGLAVFERMFLDEVEKRHTVDPTGATRKGYQVLSRHLEPGETREQALAAYRRLWMHSHENHLFETPHESMELTVRRRYELIAQCKVRGEDRLAAVEQYLANPTGFQARKLKERHEQARSAAMVAFEPRHVLVGGAVLPVKAPSSSSCGAAADRSSTVETARPAADQPSL